ncbi:MAG: PAS domain S-box protein [Erythrobacter sp.]
MASVLLAYAEDKRFAEGAEMRRALAQAELQLSVMPRQQNEVTRNAQLPIDQNPDPSEFWPVYILIVGFGLAILVFAAFYALWRAQQVAELSSTDQGLSLGRSKERLRSIFDNAGDGICGLNREGEIIFANPAAAQILGAEADGLTGDVFVSLLGPQAEMGSLNLSGQTRSHSELALKSPDGRELVIDLTATPMRNHEGSVSGTVVIFRDITKRVQTEQELRSANSELEEFAYRTSHDLRSPLVSAVALMKTVRGSIEQGRIEAASKGIQLTVSALEGLERLVEDIHEFIRIKSEDEEDAIIDFPAMVQGALDRHTYLDGFDRLKIETDFQCDMPFLNKLYRTDLIINNLISNAIKYSDPAQAQPILRVSTYSEEGSIFFKVEDNGLGIPEDQREHMFGMFKRFHPKVAFGSGLGLYMVKKNAEIIGARVSYEPCETGSRFVVVFPRKLASHQPALKHAA